MLSEQFLQTFHLARFLSVDRHGQPTYAPAEAFGCRFEPSTKLLRDKDGNQAVSEAVLLTLATVDAQDLVFMPGANPLDESEGRTPIRIDQHFDLMSGQLSFVTVHL